MSNSLLHGTNDLPGLAALFGIPKSELRALTQLATSELASGAVDLAIETLTVLTELDPFFVPAWTLLSDAHRRKGNDELAEVYREFAEGIEE